ncbi:MAG: glycosyltransferase family 2 protein [Bifidobacteriaceae bacterium]|nr:glycosyltransferase family 2 protein [Bifidobacteriaceae bacterium]
MSKKILSVIIPVYNEEEMLDELLKHLDALDKNVPDYRFEFLFIDDNSDDSTLEIIKQRAETDSRISFVSFSRNFGKEIAMLAGFDACIGEVAVVIDADLQDPPELIPSMIEYYEQGYDDVYARRSNRKGESFVKKLTSKMYYRVLQWLSDVQVQVDTGDFRLLSRKCIDALSSMRERDRNTKALFSWIGYKKKEILYERNGRFAGTTKWSYPKLMNLAISGIVSSSTKPLRIVTGLGFMTALIGFVYICIIVVQTFLGNHLDGWPSMMATIIFLGGVQLISLGVIGEYIGRIFIESKKRPPYLVIDQKVHEK